MPTVPDLVAPYRTTEYQAQYGLEKIHAAEAYALLNQDGKAVAGDSVIVGIVDDSVSLTHQEIDTNNDVAGLSVENIIGDYGTTAAAVAAGVKGNGGMHGVAYNAKIVSSEAFSNDDTGISLVANAGAKIINIGWGFGEPGIQLDIGSDDYEFFYSAISSELDVAKNKDAVITAATGSDGYLDNVSAPALFSQDARLDGIMIAVGAVDSSNEIYSLSNRCKQAKDFCLVAPGVDIYSATPTSDSSYATMSGTNMATSHVSGAAAVIRGAWPHLSAAETVQILLNTATDLGAAGVDDVYGHGLLNLYAAVQAQGQNTLGFGLSVASMQGYDVRSSSFMTNPIFGDAFALNVAPALNSAIFYDDYGRDYKAFLGNKIASQKQSNIPDIESLTFNNARNRTIQFYFGDGSKNELRLNLVTHGDNKAGWDSKNNFNGNSFGLKFITLDKSQDPHANEGTNSFSFVRNASDIAPNLKLGFAFNVDEINNSNLNNFGGNSGFISKSNFTSNPYQSFLSNSSSLSTANLSHGGLLGVGTGRKFNQMFASQKFFDKKLGLQFSRQSSYESSKIKTGSGNKENQISDLTLAFSPEIGGRKSGNFLFSFGRLEEFNNNLLNSKSLGAFEASGNTKTSYIKFTSSHAIGKHTVLLANIAEGRSKINGNNYGIFRDFSEIKSQSISAALIYENLFGEDMEMRRSGGIRNRGKIGIVYSEPMRVYKGEVKIDIPTARDVNGNLVRYQTLASLAPQGRERDLELFFSKSIYKNSEIKFNLIAQKEPGNIKNANTAYLGFFQFRKEFD